ncbi:pksn polyketide synthase for alternapyrone biosynthesis [Colletotrichum plurivorum]|uniref:Pksn polyketide synthase for alternapyrone biosynthesis n=1 Tax=Colletotrichum plurivorum TaxID=2175906 RepID=A0A8H6NBM1_9PEZI|nr:pksn polyketide synthase for alternapyrone biosynthesis [Colletotrichum plurivorum]
MSPCQDQEPIAIIGAACRLPGEAASLSKLWDMISHGKSGHGKVPSSRWDADAWYHPDPDRKGAISVKHGYFLGEDVSLFDAPFFSMTAKEAAGMDPMKRLLLEVSYEGFENAGVPVDEIANSQTGVYVGCMTNDYEHLSTHDIYDVGDVAASGMSEAMTANRVSWFFGLKGPSLTLDTACSSSLYALHLACQSLKFGETNMGLVAGVNLILHPNFMHQLSSMHMLSPEGISHSFDNRANGYGRGEGIGCLVVKRLKDALRDGDTIRAVIRATGTNADGKTPGITQPSAEAQAELIRNIYESAGLSFSDTQYFEAHGTGTPLGDPIELSAIGATLGTGRSPESGPLYVGSIKANVGHTEGCSGLAGVLKSILCLEKGVLVPTAGIEKVNPKLKLSEWNLALPSENMIWPSPGQRRISVNSFGFGGANAHVILDDAYHFLRQRGLSGNHNTNTFEDDSSESGISMGSDSPRQDDKKRLFAFSARDQGGIERLGPVYTDFFSNKLATSSSRFLGDLAYTLSSRRAHLDFRSFAVAGSVMDLQTQTSKGLAKLKRASKHENPIFVFTGQGAQWPAMGRELLDNCIFRKSINKSQALLEHYGCPWDLVDELCKTTDSNVDLPQYSQVLCTVLQIALVDLLRAWGVTPKAVVGHSSGEIGAAYAAGILSSCNAVKVAYLRGVCSAKVADIVRPRLGGMLAAGLSEKDALGYLERVPPGTVVVACVNSPSSVTLSGDRDSISKLAELISADGKFARMLRVKTAYHSPHMQTVAQEYVDKMGVILPLSVDDQLAPMFSSLTGKTVTSRDLDAKYWMQNMCEQVRFSQAMSNLLEYAPVSAQGRGRAKTQWSAFVELGPHGALQSPVREFVKASQSKAAKEAPYFSAITRGKDAELTALQLAGHLWASGHSVNLSRVNGIFPESQPMALPDLPSYPWNHAKGYWHESASTRSNRFPRSPRTDLLGVPVDLQNPMEPKWRNYLRISENPWIEDHKITSTTLYPAAGMIVMALEAAQQLSDGARTLSGVTFRNLKFERGLVVPSRDQAVQIEVSFRPDDTDPSTWAFSVFSNVSGGSWTKHCHGTLNLVYDSDKRSQSGVSDLEWADFSADWEDIQARSSGEIDMDSFYDDLEAVGVEYGPAFRNVFQAAAVPGEHCSVGSISIPDTKSVMPFNFEFPHLIHPATMDAIFHLLFIAFSDGKPLDEAAVPYTLKEMYISTDLPHGEGSVFTGYARRLRTDGRETSGNLIVSDESWSGPKLVVRDFALRQVTSSQGPSSSDQSARRVSAKIRWKEDPDFMRFSASSLPLTVDGGKVSAVLSRLIDSLTHKKPNYTAIVVCTDATNSSHKTLENIFLSFGLSKNTTTMSPVKVSIATTADEARMMVEAMHETDVRPAELKDWNLQVEDSFPFAGQQFDLVLVLDHASVVACNPFVLAPLLEAVVQRGHLGVLEAASSLSTDKETETVVEELGLSDFITIRDDALGQILHIGSGLTSAQAIMPPEIYLLRHSHPSPTAKSLEDSLHAHLRSLGCQAHSVTLEDVEAVREKRVISLLEIESPFVYRWNEQEVSQFKRLVSSANHMLWVTRGGLMQNWDGGLEFAPSQGLLRVMRTEYPHISLPHLDLSRSSGLGAEQTAKVILDVWEASVSEQNSLNQEMEFAEQDGSIFIPRFVEDDGIDTDLGVNEEAFKPIESTLATAEAWALSREDGQFVWVEDQTSTTTLGPHEVEISVTETALRTNHSDNDIEAVAMFPVGTVTAIGSELTCLAVGQPVAVMHSGSCQTKLRLSQSLVQPLPGNLASEKASMTVFALTSAKYALLEAARLEKSQSVLIYGADTPIGQAAVQLAQLVGAEVFAVNESTSMREGTSSRIKLQESRVFETMSKKCQEAVLAHTNGLGANVVLRCGQSSSPSGCLECLAECGIFIDFTRDSNSRPSTSVSLQNATIIKADFSRLLQARPAVVERLFHDSLGLLESGKITPVNYSSVVSISDVNSHVDGGSAIGDFVLHIRKDAKVLIRPSRLPELSLQPGATYVLAGGLGALGLQIAQMMFQHGAGHVVFLSRSGGDKTQAELASFRKRGLKVEALRCDVSNASHVESAVQQLEVQGCRIKGVIQCAMVLEDAIFENMTYDQWQKSTRPKIQGTMNLHTFMPKDVDFFILLSSITCVIGNAAQSNYAAGNTFEDAFAHYRRSQGLAATAIDVGLVTDSAHFTGGFDMNAYLQMYEHRWEGLQTTQCELDTVLKAAMRGRTADGRPIEPQIVLGLGSSMPGGASGVSWTKDAKFVHRVSHDSSSRPGASTDRQSAGERIAKAETSQDAVTVVEEVLKSYAAQAMDVSPDEVDAEKAFYDFGVDSLKAVELRNRIFRDLQSDMSVFELLSPSPLSKLAVEVAGRSKLVAQIAGKTDSS